MLLGDNVVHLERKRVVLGWHVTVLAALAGLPANLVQ
jgi:hypothetical protein